MSFVKINWQPDRKMLGEFSQAGMFFLGMLACPLELYRGHLARGVGFWLAAVVLRVVGLTRPEWLRLVFIGMSVIAWPIGWVVSHLALGIIYYLIFTPVALLFRLLGRDPLNRRLDPKTSTYWEPYEPDRGGRARYLRQF
jgi:hypothetical protein